MEKYDKNIFEKILNGKDNQSVEITATDLK